MILYYAPLNKNKKEKEHTTHDVEIVSLTTEIKVCLLERKYELQVARP